jgi:CO/xanthine dehydrogenase Mo-binding subunit
VADERSDWDEQWQEDSEWSETGAIKKANQVDDWLKIDPDGSVTVFSGKIDSGTGVQTALAQIVAEELDVPIERVHMVMGDTARTPDEGITAGSTTIRFGGFALRQASAQARRALLELASNRLDRRQPPPRANDHLRRTDRRETIQSHHHPPSAPQATRRLPCRRQANIASGPPSQVHRRAQLCARCESAGHAACACRPSTQRWRKTCFV